MDATLCKTVANATVLMEFLTQSLSKPTAGLAELFCLREEKLRFEPTSVNWHYTRECNYSCKFCFHTAKTSFFLPKTIPGMQESKHCLMMLRDAGMKKLNFSGGEPFLHPKELGELCRFCKEDLKLESVSIVSNGSKIRKAWLAKFGSYVDILAISCDSFVEETNVLIGRGKGTHVAHLKQVREWCYEYEVLFKLNSVINIHNFDEDMKAAISELNPVRWKVFQCLLIDGENAGAEALRDAQALVISEKQFATFLQRHEELPCLVPENNQSMKNSYLILDEELRFLNCTGGAKIPSRSIRDVSVTCALQEAGFDSQMFVKRGGIYNWSRPAKHHTVDVEDLVQDSRPVQQKFQPREEQHIQHQRSTDSQFCHCRAFVLSVVGGGVLVSMMFSLTKFRRSF